MMQGFGQVLSELQLGLGTRRPLEGMVVVNIQREERRRTCWKGCDDVGEKGWLRGEGCSERFVGSDGRCNKRSVMVWWKPVQQAEQMVWIATSCTEDPVQKAVYKYGKCCLYFLMQIRAGMVARVFDKAICCELYPLIDLIVIQGICHLNRV